MISGAFATASEWRTERGGFGRCPHSVRGLTTLRTFNLKSGPFISHREIPGQKQGTCPHHAKWPCPDHSLGEKLLDRTRSYVREKDGGKQRMQNKPGDCFSARRATPARRPALPNSKPVHLSRGSPLP